MLKRITMEKKYESISRTKLQSKLQNHTHTIATHFILAKILISFPFNFKTLMQLCLERPAGTMKRFCLTAKWDTYETTESYFPHTNTQIRGKLWKNTAFSNNNTKKCHKFTYSTPLLPNRETIEESISCCETGSKPKQRQYAA